MYLNSSETGVEMVGLAADYTDMGLPFVYAIDEDFMIAQFPVQLGNEYENETSFIYADTPENLGLDLDSLNLLFEPDSIRLNVTIIDHSTIDDFGTVTLADGEHETIRENRMEILEMAIEIRILTVWIPLPDFSISDTTHSYRWLAKNQGYPIAEVYADPNDIVFSVSYLKTTPQSTLLFNNNSAFIYPNPTGDYLMLSPELAEEVFSFSVFDLNGKLALTNSIISKKAEINVSELLTGYYMFVVHNREGNILLTRKFYKAD